MRKTVAAEVTNRRGRPLALALGITSLYFIVEVFGGILTNSLALLSDAGHMFSDIAALGLSLFAFQISRRPATAKRTYGYYRVEILASLANGLLLWLIVGVIFHEAYQRFLKPPEVQSLGMLVIAIIGLVSIYLGYNLFMSGVTEGGAALKVTWGDDKTFDIGKGGPGLIFSAFGMGIIIFSIWRFSKLRAQSP